jgi:allophanate hydrolase
MNWSGTLAIADLLNLYRSNKLRPSDVLESIYTRIADRGDDHVWIYLIPKAEVMERAHDLERGASRGCSVLLSL